VLIRVSLIPWQNQNTFQGFKSSRKPSRVVIDGGCARKTEWESAVAKGPLLLEDLTHKCRLLYISRGRGDPFILQGAAQPNGSIGYHLSVNAKAILPIGMNALSVGPWSLDT